MNRIIDTLPGQALKKKMLCLLLAAGMLSVLSPAFAIAAPAQDTTICHDSKGRLTAINKHPYHLAFKDNQLESYQSADGVLLYEREKNTISILSPLGGYIQVYAGNTGIVMAYGAAIYDLDSLYLSKNILDSTYGSALFYYQVGAVNFSFTYIGKKLLHIHAKKDNTIIKIHLTAGRRQAFDLLMQQDKNSLLSLFFRGKQPASVIFLPTQPAQHPVFRVSMNRKGRLQYIAYSDTLTSGNTDAFTRLYNYNRRGRVKKGKTLPYHCNP